MQRLAHPWRYLLNESGKLLTILSKGLLCYVACLVVDARPDVPAPPESGYLFGYALRHQLQRLTDTCRHLTCSLCQALNGAAQLLSVSALACYCLLGALIYCHLQQHLLVVGSKPLSEAAGTARAYHAFHVVTHEPHIYSAQGVHRGHSRADPSRARYQLFRECLSVKI